jgi:4-amino-4-deoxy-L-arabinose transferase-like glycosyltransferase
LLTLHLWLSALTAYAVSLIWAILAIQRIKLNKTKRKI